MAGAELRIVERQGSTWVVRAGPGTQARYSSATQRAAIDYASKELAATEGGGTLTVYTHRGDLKKSEAIAGMGLSVSPALTPELAAPAAPAQADPVEDDAGGLSQIKMGYVWLVAGAAALLLSGTMTGWDVVNEALQAQGLSQNMQDRVWYIAGQTVPAVVATILTFFTLRHEGLADNFFAKLVIVAGIFFASSLVCNALGLGRLVEHARGTQIDAPSYISFPFYVASAYINTWGVGLFLASLVIGLASAVHIAKWRDEHG